MTISEMLNGVPVAMRKKACAPITTPTAMTIIFQWLYLSSALEPSLENRSETAPEQNRDQGKNKPCHM